MAPFRKALGAVKDQTSIGLAKVSSNIAPDLDIAIVKATSHDDDPADEKHLREILSLTSYSRGYVGACVATVSKRLGKTHDWVVALKGLMLVHRLLADGDPSFQHEILYATRRGTRLLNMSDFRDEAHSNSWDHSAFVRTYAQYLDQRLECMVYERRQAAGSNGADGNGGAPPYQSPRDQWRSPPGYRTENGEQDPYGSGGSGAPGGYGSYGRRSYSSPPGNRDSYDDRQPGRESNEKKPPTPLRDMKPEKVLGRMHQLQRLLDCFLACRPTGLAKNCRMVLIALYPVIRESFQLYADICEILAVLLDRFFDMEYPDCVKSFEAYSSAAKQIDELAAFYGWCKDTGMARSSEYPEVQRITDKLLETLEEFKRDRARGPKSPVRLQEETEPVAVVADEEPVEDMNSMKALPAPPVEQPEEKVEPEVQPPPPLQQHVGELVDLRDNPVSADEQGNRLALALFSGGGSRPGDGNGNWEAFPSSGSAESEVTSAWQNPAAESGKADWELALVETASHLAKQKPALAGGFDPLLLNGMYDHGAVRQHVSAQMNSGSASSVALPASGSGTTRVLALPAPDGTVQSVGGDPFAASLSVPPPSYVQMADMEKKQHLLVQEQQLWQGYSMDGMRGQVGLDKLQAGFGYPGGQAMLPINGGGMHLNNVGYYYPSPY